MSVAYQDVDARIGDAALTLRCRVVNRTRTLWSVAAGAALGWQVYDPVTHVFISEGEWVSFDGDVAPGASATMTLRIPAPAEPGRYRVYVSPVLGEQGWLYNRGERLLAADINVTPDGIALERVRATTTTALRLSGLPAALREMLTQPFTAVVTNWRLIETMVGRDIHGRYRGSIGDMFWAVLNPLLLMLTYAFVFGMVLQTRFLNDKTPAGFILYFLGGMMPWLPFSEALARAPQSILEHRNFVKKLRFPVEVISITQVTTALVTQAIALVLYMAAIIILRDRLPWSVFWLPVLLIPQLALTLGFSWCLAALGVFVRDLGQVMGFLLTLWFFVTPICYPEQQLPKWALPVLGKNPVYILVRGYRAIFLENRHPEFDSLWKLYVVAFAALLLGYAWFRKLRRGFADVV